MGAQAASRGRHRTTVASNAEPSGIAFLWERSPALPELEAGEIHVWAVDLSASAVDRSALSLSVDERARAARYRFERDRRRYVARRSLLRAILASYVGEKPEALQFAYGALGKPQLAWPVASDPVQFNLSDCEALAVVAVARGIGVGVDVERVRGLPDMEAIAERFFSASEQAAFRRVAAPDRPGAFFRCWTRKECYLKAGGGGLTAPLDRFDVSLERYDVPLLLCVEGDPGRAASWTLHHLEPAEGFVGAVACQATGVKIGCWRWPWS